VVILARRSMPNVVILARRSFHNILKIAIICDGFRVPNLYPSTKIPTRKLEKAGFYYFTFRTLFLGSMMVFRGAAVQT